MGDLLRRLERLEQYSTAAACVCSDRPWWCRIQNAEGEFRPDIRPEPDPIECPIHGLVRANQAVIKLVRPKP